MFNLYDDDDFETPEQFYRRTGMRMWPLPVRVLANLAFLVVLLGGSFAVAGMLLRLAWRVLLWGWSLT